MQDILHKINKINGVRGTIVIAENGLVVAADFSGSEDPELLGAAASSIVSSFSTTLEKLGRGTFNRYIVTGSEGSAVVISLGKTTDALVLVVLRKESNVGLVLLELREAALDLAERITL